jgi:glutamine amidotransferase
MIALINPGHGNLENVESAFTRAGVPTVITQDPAVVDESDAVILPGDGAFHEAMTELARLNLLPALYRALDGTRPFLGICLGYQLLFSSSEEFRDARGLDAIPGVVRRFPDGPRIPHMGWNRVWHGGALRLFQGIPDGAHFYFVHSYFPEARVGDCAAPGALRLAWCDYGVRFAAAVEIGKVYATQFHPEKSQRWGQRLLENFAVIIKESR